ncbi:MAG: YbaK/EbsC family protein [Alphaproteobacteria bacterium]|jgi:prolyl-tRNA editing enzyme YbaK/EbsC (Cys-tRNA(Pro) deacylase)|nr:YbaK/EbsC family protein [Candidatus Jidaibacter sp.]
METLAKSAFAVQNELRKLNLACKVVELPNSTRTAIDAAESIGWDISQIAKSLIFKTKHTNKPVLVISSGTNQVDIKLIEALANDIIIKADANFARDITGFGIGGIPPIGHKTTIELLYIDEDLLKSEEVWAAAGTANAVFSITSTDLVKATNGRVVKIKEAK